MLDSGIATSIGTFIGTSILDATRLTVPLHCLLPLPSKVTPEKLEELKEKVPKAGPKFRLGMYFETIHDLPEFDDVAVPDDGYTSYWETDTDLDSNFDNLLFSNVTGDSASVICLDEAMDLLALREDKKQHHYLSQGNRGESQDDDIDNPFEQSAESKHSPASRNSHHSGSDGTYDGPAQAVADISNIQPNSVQDHTYETLDDCRDEYQACVDRLYTTKASDGSRGSDTVITKTAGNWSGGSDHSGQGSRVMRSHSQRLPNKHRSISLPQPPAEMMCLRDHQRKFSDSSHFAHTRRRQAEHVAPKPALPPSRGCALPSGVPTNYAEYMTAPSLPPTPEKRPSQIRGGSTKKARPPSLVIRHKGQTFVIPVVDDKKAKTNTTAKARASQVPEATAKHTVSSALPRPSASVHGSLHPNTAPIPRRHTSPPKAEACEMSTFLHRRKSRQPSQSSVSPSQSKQVTHYGVL